MYPPAAPGTDAARSDTHKQFAVSLLVLLVRNQHSHFAPYVQRVFGSVFHAIHHARPAIQQAGVTLLGDCLGVCRGRALYPRIYHQVCDGREGRRNYTSLTRIAAAGGRLRRASSAAVKRR